MDNKREQFERRIEEIVVAQLGVNKEKVKDDANICADLGADYLDMVELVMDVECKLEITIPDQMGETIQTVKQLKEVAWAEYSKGI